jgi:hypothetical protein
MGKRLPGRYCREPMTTALILMTAMALWRVRTSFSTTTAPCALKLKRGRHGYSIILVGHPRISGLSRH